MKNILHKLLTLFILTSCVCLFSGCSDEKEETIGDRITISDEYLNVSLEAEDTSASVKFTALSSWTATVKEADAQQWLTLSETRGVGGAITLELTLTINGNEGARTATVVLSSGGTVKEISVTQGGSSLQIMDEADIKDFDKYYKPAEFATMNMLRSDAKWSWFRSKQSEHFFVFWEAGFGSDPNSDTIPANMRVDIDDLLEKAEQFYTTNVEKLGFADVGQGKSYLDKYKMEIYLLYQEEWLATGSGYDNTIGALWVNPSTCQPVGSTIAHEIGHSFQYQVYCDKLFQGGTDDLKSGFRYGYEGSNGGNGFWEQCAQWQSFQNYPEEMFTSYNFTVWLANCHRHFEHEWMRYASYWLQTYWTAKHGIGTVADVWKQSASPEDAISTYMRLYCGNNWNTMKEELYDYASRMATFDIEGMREYSDGYTGRYSTNLYPITGGYYQVAYADCPETTGFNVIALNVPSSGEVVSADFVGLNPGSSLAADAPGQYMESEAVAGTVSNYNEGNESDKGWSYGFVALKSNGERVYSDRYDAESGSATFTVPAGTESLYFVVQAAPKQYKVHPWDEKELNDEQWPYKVKFNNTDLLGSVEIDTGKEPTDVTLIYDVSFPPTTDGDYTGTTVSIYSKGDMQALAQAFVMQPTILSSKIMDADSQPEEGKIAFAALKPDGTLDYNTTANGLGFWYDKDGNTIVWGDNSRVFAEFSKDNFEFTIGQYPGKCSSGDRYTIKQALIYTKNNVQYKATFVFNITIQ